MTRGPPGERGYGRIRDTRPQPMAYCLTGRKTRLIVEGVQSVDGLLGGVRGGGLRGPAPE
ncbi:hypothetical protein Misp01_64190 [Microtetraspora sp. NBRC 13810]|nr:hypothetical protein Misp01_64190 [Microtetraspora sp. NBRC 13810]